MRVLKPLLAILARFLSGSATPRENELIDKWYSALEAENKYPTLRPEEAERMHAKDLERLHARIRKRKSRVMALWPAIAAAAAVLLVFAVVYDFSVQPTEIRIAGDDGQTRILLRSNDKFFNSSDTVKEIWLADSSRILLQPKSLLSVAGSFNAAERDVNLEGEAFFDIKRNEKKPFKVYTYGVITKVLGTSFTIKAPSKNGQVTVAVKTGRVSVQSKSKPPGSGGSALKREVILTPNQQVTYSPDDAVLKSSLVDNPLPVIAPSTVRNEYEDAPIHQIISDMEDLYGVEIAYDAELLRHCKITTAFEQEGLYTRLDVLTRAIGASYSVEGIRITMVVHTNGCEI